VAGKKEVGKYDIADSEEEGGWCMGWERAHARACSGGGGVAGGSGGGGKQPAEGSVEYWNAQRAALGLKPLK
jgi:hypothetical protein